MKFTVKQIQILNSQVGEGLKIGDKTIGTGIITAMDTEDGVSLVDLAKEGLVLGYDLTEPEKNDNGEPVLGSEKIKLNEEDVAKATNYVLFIREPAKEDGTPGDCSVVLNTKDITKAFGLPDSDAEMMKKYLGATARQRQLELVEYTDLETGEESIFFVNQFDREVVDSVLDDDVDGAVTTYMNMLNSPDFRSQVVSHSFIKTFLMVIVQTGQDRYNKIHRQDIIEKAAELLSGITYWKDGELHKPSVKDINDYVSEITEHIIIK